MAYKAKFGEKSGYTGKILLYSCLFLYVIIIKYWFLVVYSYNFINVCLFIYNLKS